MHIDQEAPINVHPELIVEWNGTATYEKTKGYFQDRFKQQGMKFMNGVRHDLKILIRTMIVLASELRHMRHEGVPIDAEGP